MSDRRPIRTSDPFFGGRGGPRTLPSFSLAERDRRFARLTSLMAAEPWRLDAIVAPSTDTGDAQANTRYLCQMGTIGSGIPVGPWAVFSAAGEATACLHFEREVKFWSGHLAWPADLRWGDAVGLAIERLRELGAAKGRIGVLGVVDQFYRPEGVMPPHGWQRLREAFPDATFVPCNPMLERARAVKGPEEIAAIERVALANEAGIAAMRAVARPGRTEFEVWQAMNAAMTAATADHPARIGLGANGAPANNSIGFPKPTVLADGGVLSQEIEARYMGYRAQSNHSMLVGRAGVRAYRAAAAASIRAFEHLLGWIKPGRALGDFLAEYKRVAADLGGEARAMILHTAGLGHNRPTVGVGRFPGLRHPFDLDWEIEAGWVFAIKTEIHMAGTGSWATIGDPVAVDRTGARRLGRRRLVPMTTPA